MGKRPPKDAKPRAGGTTSRTGDPQNKTRGKEGKSGEGTPRRSAAGRTTVGRSVTIRHYCQGIGDCHLLRWPVDGENDFFMLIDCGVHSSVTGGSDLMDEIVADIATVTKRIDVLVITHEHWDHLSAFTTAAEGFESLDIGDVWLAWTENPRDPQARQLEKYKAEALSALQMASCRLAAARGRQLETLGIGLDNLLGFYFGAKGEKVRAARDAAIRMAKGKVVYHEPGDGPLTLPGVAGVNVYVLGPPRDEKLLGLMESTREMYGLGGIGSPMARALAMGFGANDPAVSLDDPDAPFDAEIGVDLTEALALANDPAHVPASPAIELLRDHYVGSDSAPPSGRGKAGSSAPGSRDWRRIDSDWLGVSAELAMQLDQRTNNSSLVLAFEFTESGRVLLFAADAQVGNWLSWHDVKWANTSGPDILARTVYYKVGHHGSQNATLKEKGLELMRSADLSAFIPVNEADAKRVRWGQMPFPDILERLQEQTASRTIRADDPMLKNGRIPKEFQSASGSIKAMRVKPGLWVEVDVA
ncbi:hypothetical protein [Methylosinus sp. PW1]|uniref:hypothetical protein n=1 Tax=Methylosinus sp. PW1 TaxID=107636 RepID=UPI0018DC61C6|nr:hypothetical protein [Methylosinus sp. PW1]